MVRFPKAVILIVILLSLGSISGCAASGRVTLCHIPEGNQHSRHTIDVDESMVETHLGHGDTLIDCSYLPCPGEMALIEGAEFCIDRWEAHIIDHSPYETPTHGAAASLPGVVPQGHISGSVAEEPCQSVGKRLCTNEEWVRACRGQSGPILPYGDTFSPGLCNTETAEHPIVTLGLTWLDSNDPRLNQVHDTPCSHRKPPWMCEFRWGVRSCWGISMSGRLIRLARLGAATYVDSVTNGPGCLNKTVIHTTRHRDHLTGFRCCKDPRADAD